MRHGEAAVPDGLDVAIICGGNGFFNLKEGVSQEGAPFRCSFRVVASHMSNRHGNVLEDRVRAHGDAVGDVNAVVSNMQLRSRTVHLPRSLSFGVSPASDVRGVGQQRRLHEVGGLALKVEAYHLGWLRDEVRLASWFGYMAIATVAARRVHSFPAHGSRLGWLRRVGVAGFVVLGPPPFRELAFVHPCPDPKVSQPTVLSVVNRREAYVALNR